MAMKPQDMAAMQAQADQEAQGAGEATKLAQQVGQGLGRLSEMLNQSQGATDQDKTQMAQILDLYIDLVEKKLGGQAPGQDAPVEEEVPAVVPADAGLRGKPMGPGTRM